MHHTDIIHEIKNLPVLTGAQQLDGLKEDAFTRYLLNGSINTHTLHHLACDVVEQAMLRERDLGMEIPSPYWEIIMVKRLWLSGEADAQMLLDARISASVSSWKKKKRAKTSSNPKDHIKDKLLHAVQLIADPENTWQVEAIQQATEAAAWSQSQQAMMSPIFWLKANDEEVLKHWIEGWNQERIWQRAA